MAKYKVRPFDVRAHHRDFSKQRKSELIGKELFIYTRCNKVRESPESQENLVRYLLDADSERTPFREDYLPSFDAVFGNGVSKKGLGSCFNYLYKERESENLYVLDIPFTFVLDSYLTKNIKKYANRFGLNSQGELSVFAKKIIYNSLKKKKVHAEQFSGKTGIFAGLSISLASCCFGHIPLLVVGAGIALGSYQKGKGKDLEAMLNSGLMNSLDRSGVVFMDDPLSLNE